MKFDEAVKTLERKLKEFKGSFTLSDAAAVTGLSIDEAREALDLMMGRYECRLRATDQGDLIYSFGATLKRRNAKSVKEVILEIAEWGWKVFTVLFKIWIAVTLVVYFIIFVILLVALIVASSSKGDSRRSPVKLDGILRIFISIFQWRTVTSSVSYKTGRDGYSYQRYEPNKSVLNKSKKNFISSVYDFVFGPPRVNLDPLTNEKEVAAYLKTAKGIITPGEMVMLAGMTYEKADTFFSNCLSRFKGDPVIADNGVVYGRFDEITRRMSQLEGGKIEYYWDEYEPEYELTGNTAGRNAGVIFMNLFNLFFSLFILSASFRDIDLVRDFDSGMMTVVLGWIPFIFSFIFFAVPVGRWFRIRKRRKLRKETNIRKRIMKYIFQRTDRSATIEEVLSVVNQPKHDKKIELTKKTMLDQKSVENTLNGMMRDYQGEVILNNEGKPVYTFQRINNEVTTAGEIRTRTSADRDMGNVIYDSKG